MSNIKDKIPVIFDLLEGQKFEIVSERVYTKKNAMKLQTGDRLQKVLHNVELFATCRHLGTNELVYPHQLTKVKLL